MGGIIAVEPDGLGEGFALGPTVIVPLNFPASAGLTAPGAMYRSRLRVACFWITAITLAGLSISLTAALLRQRRLRLRRGADLTI